MPTTVTHSVLDDVVDRANSFLKWNGESIESLSARTGIARAPLSDLLAGNYGNSPSTETLERLCDAVGLLLKVDRKPPMPAIASSDEELSNGSTVAQLFNREIGAREFMELMIYTMDIPQLKHKWSFEFAIGVQHGVEETARMIETYLDSNSERDGS